MMKNLILWLLPITLILGSCVEIIDDLTVNEDGSGVFKYNINLSSSKVKVNSILALDSLDGKRVPSLDEIKENVRRVIAELREQPGISQVVVEENYTDFIFKLTCHFESLESLQNAVKQVIRTEIPAVSADELEANWVSFNGSELVRSVPPISMQKTREINPKDAELLKTGNYTSITRFSKEITRCDNAHATISKNKLAVMLRCDPYALTQNYQLLDNRIYLVRTN